MVSCVRERFKDVGRACALVSRGTVGGGARWGSEVGEEGDEGIVVSVENR